jgi:hypothetical protein
MLLITLLDDNEAKAAQYCSVSKERNNVVLVHCCSSANVTEPREPHTCNSILEDHKRNEDILTELQMSQITEFVYQYRKNWKGHVDRMISDRISKMVLKYQPKGKRSLGRPLKRWKDSVL